MYSSAYLVIQSEIKGTLGLVNVSQHVLINYVATVEMQALLAPVVQRLDNAIHRINHYPADRVVCFVNTYPLDSDLSGG